MRMHYANMRRGFPRLVSCGAFWPWRWCWRVIVVRRPRRPAGWIGKPCATVYTATTSRGSAACRIARTAVVHHRSWRPEEKTQLGAWVSQGSDIAEGGVVRWRLRDLRDRILARFSVPMDERSVGRTLKTLTFSHISVGARHPQADRGVGA